MQPTPEQSWKTRLSPNSPTRVSAGSRGSHYFQRTLRNRIDKSLAIALGQNAIVEDHHDAAVAFRPDEAADPLAKFQNRLREREFAEGISAARFNGLDARLDQRMIRH